MSNYLELEQQLIVEINEENAKCKQIIFKTMDETLVRAAMLKLGFPNGTFKLFRGTVSIK